jgi:hypothetical protein
MSDEVKTTLEFDAAEGKHVLRHTQDVSSILDANRRAQADSIGSRFGDFARVASIPMAVVLEWKQKYGINAMAPTPEDKIRMVALLNDPDYAYLRTRGGKL